jgi:iron complex transport system substrate-binding protein
MGRIVADRILRIAANVGARRSVPLQLVLILALAFPSFSFSATFADEMGNKLDLKSPPRRIISLAPSITEALFALGLRDRIAGVTTFCNYPPEALQKEKVGGYVTPSLEKIIALKPDLVIGPAEGELKPFVTELVRFGIPVYIVNPRSLADVLSSIRNIGEVTAVPAAAGEIVRAMKRKMQIIQEKTKGLDRPRVLHVLAHDPLISSGKDAFVSDLIRLAGGINIAEVARGKHPHLSMEEVVARDPQVILLSSMKSGNAGQKKWWSRWREISAVRSNQIYVMESDLVLRPSPRIVDGFEEVAKALHPRAFQPEKGTGQSAR